MTYLSSPLMRINKVGFTHFAILEDFWGKEWCERTIEAAQEWNLTQVPAGTYNGWKTGVQKRNIATFTDSYNLMYRAEPLSASWQKLDDAILEFNKATYNFELDEKSNVFMNEYHKGYELSWHRDEDESVEDLFKRTLANRISVSIFLNDDFDGGEFELEGIGKWQPRAGTAIIFPSAQLHRGAIVTKGTKYNLTYWRKGNRCR